MSGNFSNFPNNNVVDLTVDSSSGSDTEPDHVTDVIDISSGSEAEVVPEPAPAVNFWVLANPNPAPINHFWGVNHWNPAPIAPIAAPIAAPVPVPIDHFWGSSTSESSGSDWPNDHVEPVGNLQPLPNHVPAGDEAASDASDDSVSLGETDTDSTASYEMSDYDSDDSDAFYIEPPIPPQLPDFCGMENDPDWY